MSLKKTFKSFSFIWKQSGVLDNWLKQSTVNLLNLLHLLQLITADFLAQENHLHSVKNHLFKSKYLYLIVFKFFFVQRFKLYYKNARLSAFVKYNVWVHRILMYVVYRVYKKNLLPNLYDLQFFKWKKISFIFLYHHEYKMYVGYTVKHFVER